MQCKDGSTFVRLIYSILLLFFIVETSLAFPRTSDEFDEINIGGTQLYKTVPVQREEVIAHFQIIMDRSGISPGVIDGLDTRRFRSAFEIFNQTQESPIALNDNKSIERLLDETGGDAFTTYTITAADLSYKFTPEIPELYIKQASMRRIDYKSVQELLAERFHMDEAYLLELNHGRNFDKIGSEIIVASFGRDLQKRVSRIEADKSNLQVRAFAQDGTLVAAYPASIGSSQTPSPKGAHTVRNKAQNPAYTYDPKGSAQPGLSKGLVLLPPGPNGPVGDAWIGLSKRTYGIHGTPEPSQIGIAQSVGCIRLTNWDALELARLVKRGVKVNFIE